MNINRMKHLAFILFFCLLACPGFSQHNNPLYVEIPAENQEYKEINLGKNGLLIFTPNNMVNTKNNKSHSFILFDRGLFPKWSKSIYLTAEFMYVGHQLMNETMMRFTFTKINPKAKETEMAWVDLNLNTGEDTTAYTTLHLDNSVAYLTFGRDNMMFLTGKGSSISYVYDDLKTNQLTSISLASDNKQYVASVLFDSLQQIFYVMLAGVKNKNLTFTLYAIHNQTLLWQQELQHVPAGMRFITADMLLLSDGRLLITGTYNHANEQAFYETNYDAVTNSAGFYAAIVERGDIKQCQTLNYTQFNHPEQYLSKPAWMKMSKALEKNKNTSMNYLVNTRTEVRNGKICMIGEGFTREVKQITETYYDAYGRLVPYVRTIFQGYAFHDLFFAIVDSNARFVNHTIADISAAPMIQRMQSLTDFLIDSNMLVYAYNKNGIVYYQNIHLEDQMHEAVENFKISAPNKSNDKIVETYYNNISYWYDKSFVALGYQAAQNNVNPSKNKRVFYYLCKIIYGD